MVHGHRADRSAAPDPKPRLSKRPSRRCGPISPRPITIVFDNKYGKSTFTHKLHYERVNGDCTVCHNKIFPQSRAPINYGKAQHRVAEAEGTSCAYLPSGGGYLLRGRQQLR